MFGKKKTISPAQQALDNVPDEIFDAFEKAAFNPDPPEIKEGDHALSLIGKNSEFRRGLIEDFSEIPSDPKQ